MIAEPLIAELLDSSGAFYVPLRMGEGFDESAYRRLCDALQASAAALTKDDAVPKRVVNVLIDLVPALDAARYLYRGALDERLNQAIDELSDLAQTCAVEGDKVSSSADAP